MQAEEMAVEEIWASAPRGTERLKQKILER